jgi:hypothetical protein
MATAISRKHLVSPLVSSSVSPKTHSAEETAEPDEPGTRTADEDCEFAGRDFERAHDNKSSTTQDQEKNTMQYVVRL